MSYNPGIEFLEKQSNADSQAIDYRVLDLDRKTRQEKIHNVIKQLDSNPSLVWKAFDNVVFLGDSRISAFYEYDFLSSSRLFANLGDTIGEISTYMTKIKELQPAYVVISYGINDIESGN